MKLSSFIFPVLLNFSQIYWSRKIEKSANLSVKHRIQIARLSDPYVPIQENYRPWWHKCIYLKEFRNVVCSPVSKLVNMSIRTGTVPHLMKIAKVLSLYKSKECDDFTNYSPISLLPALSKILERVIYKRLYNCFTLNNVSNTSQYGFRSGHSTVHTVTEFVRHVIESIAWLFSRNICTSIKSFHTIIHSTLLQKLEQYGICGTPLKWFASYPSDKMHYVNYTNVKSELMNVTCGVPQGSVLGHYSL